MGGKQVGISLFREMTGKSLTMVVMESTVLYPWPLDSSSSDPAWCGKRPRKKATDYFLE